MLNAQIKQTEPLEVAYLAMHGPYDQIPDGYERLYEWVEARGLRPAGMPEAVYLTVPNVASDKDAEWELWAPVMPARSTTAAESGLGVKHVAEETVASAIHKGPYDSLPATYDALVAWIGDNGYRIVGPPRELYLSDPDKVPIEETMTEVQFPVKMMS